MKTSERSDALVFSPYALAASVAVALVGLFAFATATRALTITPNPPTATSTGSTSATISWTTDEAATTQVLYGTTTAYTASSTYDPTLVTNHSVVLSSLIPSTVYHFMAQSTNSTTSTNTATSSDNTFTTTSDGTSTATTTPTTTAPIISSVDASTTDTTANITWHTDQSANSQVTYGTTTAYGITSILDTALVNNHSLQLTSLSPNTTYHFFVRSANASGTLATSSDMTFTTASTTGGGGTPTTTPTTSAPTISSVVVASTTDTTATITWNTDQTASSQVLFGTTSAYTASSSLDTSLVTGHTVTLYALSPNTQYHFSVWSANASGTAATSSDMTFTTASTTGGGGGTPTTTPTTTAPIISSVSASTTDSTATITWHTDQSANSQVTYGTTTAYGIISMLDTAFVNHHSLQLTGLSPNTTYHFYVSSANASGTLATSSDMTFTTASTTGGGGGTGGTGSLQDQINQLFARVAALEHQIMLILQQLGNNNGGGGGGGTATTTTAYIDQNGRTIRSGDTVDFGGHGFGLEENVTMTRAGNTIAIPHADGGGNFSTGSVQVPTTPGTYVYTFTGQKSGKVATATITVIP